MRADFDACCCCNHVFAAVATEVQHISTGEWRDSITFIGDVVAVHFEERTEPITHLVVGVQMPTEMIRIAERAVAVIGGEEVVHRRAEMQTAKAFVVEAGAGEKWHELVAWTLANGFPGMESLAMVPR